MGRTSQLLSFLFLLLLVLFLLLIFLSLFFLTLLDDLSVLFGHLIAQFCPLLLKLALLLFIVAHSCLTLLCQLGQVVLVALLHTLACSSLLGSVPATLLQLVRLRR